MAGRDARLVHARLPLEDKFRSTDTTIWTYVIMPNHVHLLCSLIGNQALPTVLHGWKGGSSNEINRTVGRSGKLWAKDYFDRLVRDEKHFWNCALYIRGNPRKAKLKPAEFSLFESNYVARVLDDLDGGSYGDGS